MKPRSTLQRPMRSPLLVSFSGLDGSGKSTQIENLRSSLEAAGYRTRLLTFWDDVVVFSRYREQFVHRVYNNERGIGAPGKPVNRRDKNIRKGYLTLARHALYFLDALHLVIVVGRARRSGAHVILMDRYSYDEWANLPLHNPVTRAYVRLLDSVVPRPDIAYLLDADAPAVCERKPEYPLEFMVHCRAAYHSLAELLGAMTTISPLPLERAKIAVEGPMRIALGDEISREGRTNPDQGMEQLPAA